MNRQGNRAHGVAGQHALQARLGAAHHRLAMAGAHRVEVQGRDALDGPPVVPEVGAGELHRAVEALAVAYEHVPRDEDPPLFVQQAYAAWGMPGRVQDPDPGQVGKRGPVLQQAVGGDRAAEGQVSRQEEELAPVVESTSRAAAAGVGFVDEGRDARAAEQGVNAPGVVRVGVGEDQLAHVGDRAANAPDVPADPAPVEGQRRVNLGQGVDAVQQVDIATPCAVHPVNPGNDLHRATPGPGRRSCRPACAPAGRPLCACPGPRTCTCRRGSTPRRTPPSTPPSRPRSWRWSWPWP